MLLNALIARFSYLKIKFMKNKIIYIIFIIAIYINSVYSQTYYYGKNKIGQMVFLDDILCLVSFINYAPDKPIIDTCFYKKYDNKIVLNSKYKHKFDITPMDTTIIIDNSVPMIFKSYFNKSLNDYYIDQEFIVDVDTINNQFIIKNDSRYLYLNTIFIISYKNKYYKMFFYLYPKHDEKYYLVKYHQNIMNHSLYFDNFSFIIKGNRLIPYYYFSKDIFI